MRPTPEVLATRRDFARREWVTRGVPVERVTQITPPGYSRRAA